MTRARRVLPCAEIMSFLPDLTMGTCGGDETDQEREREREREGGREREGERGSVIRLQEGQTRAMTHVGKNSENHLSCTAAEHSSKTTTHLCV